MDNSISFHDRIMAAATVSTKKVHIAEWGETLTIQQLPAEALIDKAISSGEDRTASARDIVASVIDEDGQPVFSETDIPKILKWKLAGFLRLMSEIHAFNGIGEAETIKKNSKKNRSTSSASDSPNESE